MTLDIERLIETCLVLGDLAATNELRGMKNAKVKSKG
jgi:hypothetical protein